MHRLTFCISRAQLWRAPDIPVPRTVARFWGSRLRTVAVVGAASALCAGGIAFTAQESGANLAAELRRALTVSSQRKLKRSEIAPVCQSKGDWTQQAALIEQLKRVNPADLDDKTKYDAARVRLSFSLVLSIISVFNCRFC